MSLGFNANQFLSLILLAIALGMDAFSLGIGIGLRNISFKNILKVSITIGIFHIIMPLIGVLIGRTISVYIGDIAGLLGGIILIFLGANMLWSTIIGIKKYDFDYTSIFGLLLLAFSVSIDALSVGFTLGLISLSIWLVIFVFGIFGAVMSGIGLYLGNKISILIGDYGEVFGGIVLIIFGLKLLV